MNRPPANALTSELIVALRQAIEMAPQQGKRALVLSGTPGRFSGGLDIPVLLTLNRPEIAAVWRELYALLKALAASPIPIAAAITGHAPAGGTVLALFCDCRVMAAGDFKLGLNEVQVGLPLPPVILAALRRLIGPRQAERLAVSGLRCGGILLAGRRPGVISPFTSLLPKQVFGFDANRSCHSLNVGRSVFEMNRPESQAPPK